MDSAMQEAIFFPQLAANASFTTNDLDESARYMNRTSFHTLRPVDPRPRVEMAHWEMILGQTHLDLVKLTCGDAFSTEKGADSDWYVVQIPITGVCELQLGRDTMTVAPGNVFVLNPSQAACKRWSQPCMQLMVQVNRWALERVLYSELGCPRSKPISFDPSVQEGEAGRALSAIISSIWRNVLDQPKLQQWRISQALERSLLVTVLGVLPNNYSDAFHKAAAPAAPYYVKRAEDYIRANVTDVIEIEDLVAAAGVSSRSLYYGFRRWRDTTPMEYLRSLRLALAHEKLKSARISGDNVTRVALGVGYEHLSRFSKDYKQKFGQSPSATLLQSG